MSPIPESESGKETVSNENDKPSPPPLPAPPLDLKSLNEKAREGAAIEQSGYLKTPRN